MADFKVLGTNHTSFTVNEIDRVLAFLGEGLGYHVSPKAPRAPTVIEGITGITGADIVVAFARGHGHAIELIQYRGPADRNTMVARPCDVGFAHVALDVDNIEAAIAMAARYGFKPMAPPVTVDLGPNAGARVAYLRDHEGLSFEFIQKPPA